MLMIPRKPLFAVRVVFVLAMIFPGCSRNTAIEEWTVVHPSEFQLEGSKWAKTEWTDEHDKRLTAYFAKNPGMAANPLLAGERVAYADGKGLERFYWVLPAQRSAAWICLEFKGKSFVKLLEGSGEPFHSTTKS